MKLSLLTFFVVFLVLVVLSFSSSREPRNKQDEDLAKKVTKREDDDYEEEYEDGTFSPWDIGGISHITRLVISDEILKALAENITENLCLGCCDTNVTFNPEPRNGERAGVQSANKNIAETRVNLPEVLGTVSNSTSERCWGCCSVNSTHISELSEPVMEAGKEKIKKWPVQNQRGSKKLRRKWRFIQKTFQQREGK